MANYRLKLINHGTASGMTVIETASGGLAAAGDGPDNFLCGACSRILCKNIEHGQISNMAFKCCDCGSLNISEIDE